MLKITQKFTALALIIAMNVIGLSGVGYTQSYYNDTESSNNIFSATSLDFSVTSQIGRLKTRTQGGWGAGAQGNNSGVYRDANFAGAFPAGVTIGDGAGFSALFSTSQDVEDFLPAIGTANPFTQNYTNPNSTSAGVLAGQILALSLNVGFDEYDSDFAKAENNLADYVLPETTCSGLTVSEVLTEGNNLLAGLASEFSPTEINVCVTFINEVFDTEDEGFLHTFASLFNVGALDFQYNIFADALDAECDTLSLEALLDGNLVYTGDLVSLDAGAFDFSDPEDWEFLITEPSIGSCSVDIVFNGWQQDFLSFGGYNDEERVRIDLVAPNPIVLNEFLPKPDGEAFGFDFGNDSSDMPQGEWVELYNNSNFDFDVSGWYIHDASGSASNKVFITNTNTVPATTIVPAKGWLVVYLNKAILNNTGDTVKLLNGADTLVDEYTYSDADFCIHEPTPEDPNEPSVSDPVCSEVPSNKSYARIPDGVGAWVDPVPTPGNFNTEDELLGEQSLMEFAETITLNDPTVVSTTTESTIADNVGESSLVEELVINNDDTTQASSTEIQIITEETDQTTATTTPDALGDLSMEEASSTIEIIETDPIVETVETENSTTTEVIAPEAESASTTETVFLETESAPEELVIETNPIETLEILEEEQPKAEEVVDGSPESLEVVVDEPAPVEPPVEEEVLIDNLTE